MGLGLSKTDTFAIMRIQFSLGHQLWRKPAEWFFDLFLPQTVSSLDFSRELRDQIYQEVSPRRICPNRPLLVLRWIFVNPNGLPKGVNFSKDKSPTSIYNSALSGLTHRYPILFVDRQVSEEALEMLYDGSIFSFEEGAISWIPVYTWIVTLSGS